MTVPEIRFTPLIAERATEIAQRLFRLRQGAGGMHIEVNPSWEMLTQFYYERALRGEKGVGQQEQCILQGIRLAIWESRQIPAPWSKAFPAPQRESVTLPVETVAEAPTVIHSPKWWRRWYEQARAIWRRFVSKLNDYL